MLPFLKKDEEGSVSVPVETKKRTPDEDAPFDALETAGQDLCDAVHAKDAKAVAQALRAAFELLESEPHEEGEHT